MSQPNPPPALLQVARDAITAQLHDQPYDPPALDAPWHTSRGVFVTLRTPDGQLRGCIGHLEPVCDNLAAEIAACALSAAFRDSRFYPLRAAELEGLQIEISLMTPPEPIDSARALDPARYGVVVTSGNRRGVLLPAIDGIDRVEEQVRIASQKAGIPPGTPRSLERFEVVKISD